MVKKDMQSAILDYFKNFTDLKITVNEMFLSADGTRTYLALQEFTKWSNFGGGTHCRWAPGLGAR